MPEKFYDIMARGYGKPHYPKNNEQFLREAGVLIELVNLVDNYRLDKTKFNKRYRNNNTKPNKEVQAIRREKAQINPRRRYSTSSHASKSKSQIRIRNKRVSRHSKTLAVSYKIKSQSSRAFPKQFKKISRSKLKTQRTEKHKNGQNVNKEADKLRRSISNPKSVVKAFTGTAGSEITNCLLSKLAMKNGRTNLLKDLSRLIEYGDTGKTPTVTRSKNSKASFKSSKNYQDSSNLRKESRNHSTEKRYNKKISFTEYSKPAVKKSSFNLNLNFNLKPSSDVINLRIKTTKKTHTPHTDRHDVSGRYLDQYDPIARQEQINKLLIKQLLSKLTSNYTEDFLKKSFFVSSNDHERHFLYEPSNSLKTIIPPHNNTQAVYNVFDIQRPLEYRKVRGIKSSCHLHVNFNNLPRNAQPINTEDTSTGTKSSKQVKFRSGASLSSGDRHTSLQQSFSFSTPRSDYESEETCDCEPPESDVFTGSEPLESSLCETCCHEEEMERLRYQQYAYEHQPRSFSQNFSSLLRRTKRRINYRVDQVRSDPSLLVTEPCNFLKRMYRKCTDKSQQDLKNAGNCTCTFIDTQRVSVMETDGAQCSVLKRLFGNLIFSDKCVVCAGRKVELKHHKCEPGTCIESKPLFGCLTKLYAKCKPKNKKKEKPKEKKGTLFCRILSCIREECCEPKKKKKEKDDKRCLLSKCCKFKKHGDKSGEGTAKRGLRMGRRHFRYCTKRIRDRYYRNKKLAQEQKGQFACDFYLMSLRHKPCIWVYYMCPFCYPYCLQALGFWRQIADLLLFFVAILIWSPCICVAECLRMSICI